MAVGAGTARDGQNSGHSNPKCSPDLQSGLSPNCLLLSTFKKLLKKFTCVLSPPVTSSMGRVVLALRRTWPWEVEPGTHPWPWVNLLCDSGQVPTSATSVYDLTINALRGQAWGNLMWGQVWSPYLTSTHIWLYKMPDTWLKEQGSTIPSSKRLRST